MAEKVNDAHIGRVLLTNTAILISVHGQPWLNEFRIRSEELLKLTLQLNRNFGGVLLNRFGSRFRLGW